MSIEGKKIKQQVGKLKEALDKIISSTDTTTDAKVVNVESLSKVYQLLILSELNQRGVVTNFDIENQINSNDENLQLQLQQAIIGTAGKSLLDENHVKPPLIAGAAVVSALIAQTLAHSLQQLLNGNDSSFSISARELSSGLDLEGGGGGVFQRVKDVGDVRLSCLLKIGTSTGIVKQDATKAAGSSASLKDAEGAALLLQRMAFGNYLRAASFSNPEQPPMFKRSLDSCLEVHATLLKLVQKVNINGNAQALVDASADVNADADDYLSYYTRDAITPLSNLIRIAESKKNTKRVSELSLRIAQSYIGDDRNHETYGQEPKQSHVLSESGCQIWNDIDQVFVNAYAKESRRGPKRTEDGTATPAEILAFHLKMIEKAKTSLEKVHLSNDDKDHDDNEEHQMLSLLHKHLDVSVELAHENILASMIGNERYVAARNRSGLSSGTTTKSGFVDLVKRELVAGTLPSEDKDGVALDYDPVVMDDASKVLRDEFLALVSPSLLSSSSLSDSVCFILTNQVDRLVMRAQTVALDRYKKKKRDDVFLAWDNLLHFVCPLIDSLATHTLDNYNEDPIQGMVLSQQTLMKTACEALLTHSWMSPDNFKAPVESIRHAADFLFALLKTHKAADREEKVEREKVEGKVLGTTASSVSKFQMSLEVACRAARCHQLLISIGSDKNISSDEANQIQELSAETISDLKSQNRSKHLPELDAKFGVPFLRFLVCWSGLHHSPWSYCNVSQARSILRNARESIKNTAQIWGRKLTAMEENLIEMGEADAESGFLSGGMSAIATKLYDSIFNKLIESEMSPVQMLLKAHCTSCSARLQLMDSLENSGWIELADAVKVSMSELQKTLASLEDPSDFYLWREPLSLRSSVEYHVLLKMQLVAELLLEGQKPSDAQGFLEKASKDSPQNYDIAFSYGSFILQMALYNNDFEDPGMMKKAQKQLLKAAKLNVNKADPFALLGIWYEVQNDTKRAVGCYSKALLVDPSHPVAGRGVLRLKSARDVSTLCNNAMNQGIFQNGWAWKSFGDSKAYGEGDDEKAVLCYHQALRARDVGSPKQHRLNVFFSLPSKSNDSEYKECGSTWASLGSCYRRLGKHSASVRAFQSASDIYPSDLSYFCSWAQVELELGLLDEAAKKFQLVLNTDASITQYSAGYGLASCMLLFARQSAEEGKFGDALSCLKKGIDSLSVFTDENVEFSCVWKLLGDLYSHGFIIPASVFVIKSDDNVDGNEQKIKFISQGEDMYKHIISSVEKMQDQETDTGSSSLQTIAYNDLAINLLLRARVRSECLHEGSGIGFSTSRIEVSNEKGCRNLLDLSIEYFTNAIEMDPLFPMSWCGLGTALVSKDPILAQHAFCRALQLDKATEDAWANLSLLFFDYNNITSSEEAVDSLTQVADSAIMWIVRGLLLEKEFKGKQSIESVFSKASDAYRASLQISRNQAAYLGLSLTSRRLDLGGSSVSGDYVKEANKVAARESHVNLHMFLNSSGSSNLGAVALDGLMTCERSAELQGEQAKVFLEIGKGILKESQGQIAALPESKAPESIDSEQKLKVSPFVTKEDIDNILSLSLDCANKVLDSTSDDSTNENESMSISRARHNVILNPDSGLMWLDLSKALLGALSPSATLESAAIVKSAVQKAKQIMTTCATDSPLLNPTSKGSLTAHKSIPSTPVSSSKLAEVFALSDWVQDISPDDNSSNAYDLQRSVLLDPENFFARTKIDE